MKIELIDKLFKEFEKDEKAIKKKLLIVMDKIILECKDEYGTIKMVIEYKKNDK